MADPVSIRTNNPGAQWYGPIARQYGATGTISGLPGGNNAAQFPDPISGAAAQFGLLQRSYAGMPLSAAINKWGGGNSAQGYTNFITQQTGILPDTVLTPELLASPQGAALAKSMAHWEAGRPYPLTDEQWKQAQGRAFNSDGELPAGAPGLNAAAIGAQSSPAGVPLFTSQAQQQPNGGNPLAAMGLQMMQPQAQPMQSMPPMQLRQPQVDYSGLQALLRGQKGFS